MPASPSSTFSPAPPDRGGTLLEMLRRSADACPSAGVRVMRGGKEVRHLPFSALYEEAGRLASGLLNQAEVRPGDRVGLLLSTRSECIVGFFGVLSAGAVPVPLPPPMPFSNLDHYIERLRSATTSSGIRLLLGADELQGFLGELERGLGGDVRVRSIGPLLEAAPAYACQEVTPESPALILYTSGSTSAPRGAVLSHRNVMRNLEAIRTALRMTALDAGCAWLPLFHNMGLIGCLLTPIYAGVPTVLMPPEDFVMDPGGWLSFIGQHRGTIAPAPNAAFLHCVRRVDDGAVRKLDLSSWRAALVGAEPVDAAVARRFCDHFRAAGFRPEAMMPVYGMTEVSLAATFPPVERGLRTLWVSRSALGRGEVEPLAPGHPDGREMVSVGAPIQDMQLRLEDAEGRPAAPGRVGEVLLRGASVMAGYDRNEAASRAVFREGWLATGDLGFLHEGELYVAGRIKEMFIFQGQNFYASDVEAAVRRVAGIVPSGVMAVGIQVDGSEGVVVLAETLEKHREEQLAAEIREAVFSAVGLSPREVVMLDYGQLPRTPSGKLERQNSRALYEQLRAGRR